MSKNQSDTIEEVFKQHGITKRTSQTITLKKTFRYYIKHNAMLDIQKMGKITGATFLELSRSQKIVKQLRDAGCTFTLHKQY